MRANNADVDATAKYLGIDARLVRAALDTTRNSPTRSTPTPPKPTASQKRSERAGSACSTRSVRLALDNHYSPIIAQRYVRPATMSSPPSNWDGSARTTSESWPPVPNRLGFS
ncbi:MAG: hypothetical protein M3450_03075 [Actinomycetota bacterium]|nr:hypothetical protein [Actinomycetota bacterium]